MSEITGNTAVQAEQQVENGRYKQLKISVNPELASAFKEACAASDTSMPVVLSGYMAEFSKSSVARKDAQDYSTRRRTAIQAIVKQLEQIRDWEERYRDRIPENLQESRAYGRADELISTLEEVINLMAAI